MSPVPTVRMTAGRTLALLATVGLAACASRPVVQTEADPAVDFSQYRSYVWLQQPSGIAPLQMQRIVAGIEAQLAARGWSQEPSAEADVALAVHITTEERQSIDTFYASPGYGSWGWSGWGIGLGTATSQVRNYEVGTLIVDVFDNHNKRAVWRGTATGTVPSTLVRVNEAIDDSIQRIFAEFPAGN